MIGVVGLPVMGPEVMEEAPEAGTRLDRPVAPAGVPRDRRHRPDGTPNPQQSNAPCRHCSAGRVCFPGQLTATPSAAYTSLLSARLRGSALALVASNRFATYA